MRYLLSCFLAFALAGQALAAFPHEESDLEPDPGIRFGVLDNGMRYALFANDTPTGEAAVRLLFDFGSLMEAEHEQGLAHFIEHMAFNGTTNVPEGEMVKILERLGLAFGADSNASTGFEHTTYELDLPSVEDEVLDSALMLLREVASEITFDAEAIDRERGVLLSELRVRNTPGFRAWQHGATFLLPDVLATKRLPGGKAEVIETADRDTFVDLYRRFYQPERAALVFVGDVDLDDIEKRIEGRFGDWRGVGEPGEAPALGSVSAREAEADSYIEEGITNSLSLAAVEAFEERPESRAERARGYAEIVAASVVNRRLQRLARAEDAPFLGAFFGRSDLARTATTRSIGTSFAPGGWARALRAVDMELRRALEHGFTQAEIDEQLANLRTMFENGERAAATRSTHALARGITNSLAEGIVYTHPSADRALFDEVAPTLTPEHVHGILRELWPTLPTLLHATLSEPPEGGNEALLAALDESRTVMVEPPPEAETEAFAYQAFGTPGEVVSRRQVEDLDFEQIVFANGLRLNFKQTDFQDNQVLARAAVDGGRRDLSRSLAGLDRLVAIGLISGGLEAHSIDDLQRLLAGRSVGVSANLGETALTFAGGTTPDDMLLQLQLWSAFLKAPAYRSEAQAQFRRLIEGTYASIDTTPAGVAQRDVPRLIRGGDPRYGIPPRETLEARNLEELSAFLGPILGAGAIEIGVVGVAPVEDVIEVVAATLGALPPREPPTPFELVDGPSFPERSVVTLDHRGPEDQALVALYWPATDGSDQQLAARVDLLGSVLQLRLTERIREELGATYSPSFGSALSNLYRGFGYLVAQSEVSVDDVDRMIDAIADVVEGFAERPVSSDELQRARQPLLEGFESAQESNGYWLGVIDQAQGRPASLEAARSTVRWLEETEAEDLTELARRFLVPDTRYVVRVVPAEASDDEP